MLVSSSWRRGAGHATLSAYGGGSIGDPNTYYKDPKIRYPNFRTLPISPDSRDTCPVVAVPSGMAWHGHAAQNHTKLHFSSKAL